MRIVSFWLVFLACSVVGCPQLRAGDQQPDQFLPSWMNHAEDYTFMWWAHGWRGRSADGHRILCVQTNHYGFSFDADAASMTHLGPISDPQPQHQAASQSNDVVLGLPTCTFQWTVVTNGKQYHSASAAPKVEDVRIQESGKFVQHVEILGVRFEDESGQPLADASGTLEFFCWPDRIGITLQISGRTDVQENQLRLDTSIVTSKERSLSAAIVPVKKGNDQVLELVDLEATGGKTVEVSARGIAPYENSLAIHFNPTHGSYDIALPRHDVGWKMGKDLDRLERVQLILDNPGENPETVRLRFRKDYGFKGIVGLSPMIRDEDGFPTGLPVQISKNWHGPAWFHGSTVMNLAPQSKLNLELTIAYARWGGVPAASHAQLSLVGWGTHQLWDESAVGSFGESICYDPDVNLNRSMVDDIRPLMVWSMTNEADTHVKWGWTHNVGGADFLVYYDDQGDRQYLSRVRTSYEQYSPCLTKVMYSGVSPDRKISAKIITSTMRTDDIVRGFYRLRYDVHQPTQFTRMVFFQLGADNYNDHQFKWMARGNTDGLKEKWEPETGGHAYSRYMTCEGDQPWFALCGGDIPEHRKKQGGAWANRGVIIRSWKARLGGKQQATPRAGIHGSENHLPSATVDIVVPPEIKTLLPGDFVEAEIELAVLPQQVEDYYGPNQHLRRALAEHPDSWQPTHREAQQNHLSIVVNGGKLLSRYPVRVQATDSPVDLTVQGGAGYVPLTFTGLTSYRGWRLLRFARDQWQPVDQTVHGNDWWQTDLNSLTQHYEITFNLPFENWSEQDESILLRFYSD
jgi:hypothetical protein